MYLYRRGGCWWFLGIWLITAYGVRVDSLISSADAGWRLIDPGWRRLAM